MRTANTAPVWRRETNRNSQYVFRGEKPMQTNTNGHDATMMHAVQTLRVPFVPPPTGVYRQPRKAMRATVEPGVVRVPSPPPGPLPIGARALIWKQDPSVDEIGIRKIFLPGATLLGPRDARIVNGVPG